MKWVLSASPRGALAAVGIVAAISLASGQANGAFVVDFESFDNGASLDGATITSVFGYSVTISSGGPNLGAAAFDSTIGGPNAGGGDPDLLVDLGNILILQNDMFPRLDGDNFSTPNDDPNGGSVSFELGGPEGGPVGVESIDLIDIDANNDDVTIILMDSSGNMRTYLVPDNWTSPNANEESGTWDTLDLRTLDDQIGAGGSIATAIEDEGFNQDAIINMEVLFAGSSGLDNIVIIPAPSAAVLLLTPLFVRRRRRS